MPSAECCWKKQHSEERLTNQPERTFIDMKRNTRTYFFPPMVPPQELFWENALVLPQHQCRTPSDCDPRSDAQTAICDPRSDKYALNVLTQYSLKSILEFWGLKGIILSAQSLVIEPQNMVFETQNVIFWDSKTKLFWDSKCNVLSLKTQIFEAQNVFFEWLKVGHHQKCKFFRTEHGSVCHLREPLNRIAVEHDVTYEECLNRIVVAIGINSDFQELGQYEARISIDRECEHMFR